MSAWAEAKKLLPNKKGGLLKTAFVASG